MNIDSFFQMPLTYFGSKLSYFINIFYSLLFAFILGLLIAYVYKKTSRSVSYSHSFVNSLVLILPVIALIIIFISNSIPRAIGLFGAFSVIRFRTAIKDAKDMFFVLWVLATGFIIGVDQIPSAFLSTIVVSGMVYLLKIVNFGQSSDSSYILACILEGSKTSMSDVSESLEKYVVKQDILNIQTTKDEKQTELTMSLILKKQADLNQMVSGLKKNNGLKALNINPSKFNLEY